MVRLPFKTGNLGDISNSLPIATALYARKESRSRPEIRKQYNECLREYRELEQYDDFLHEHRELGHVTKRRVSLFSSVSSILLWFAMSESSNYALSLMLQVRRATALRLAISCWSDRSCSRICRPQLFGGGHGHSVHVADISRMFLQMLVDPAISIDATITEKIAAEARQLTVLHLDCISKRELTHRYSNWTRLVRITIYVRQFLGNLKRRRSSQVLEWSEAA